MSNRYSHPSRLGLNVLLVCAGFSCGLPSVGLAQDVVRAPMPEAETLVAAFEVQDIAAMTQSIGARVELMNAASDFGGFLSVPAMFDKLEGCSASFDPERKDISLFIRFDCPPPEGFEIGDDCLTENWTLLVQHRGEGEIRRTGVSTPVGILAQERSREGECALSLTPPPVAALDRNTGNS